MCRKSSVAGGLTAGTRSWDDGARLNALDLLLLVVLVIAGSSGYRRGLALQAFSFGGLLVGLVVGALFAPAVAGLVESPAAQAAAAAVTLIALAGAGDAGGWLLGTRLRERAHAKGLARADAVGGSVIAVIASLLGCAAVAPEAMRRNLAVAGINLLALRARRFAIGSLLFEGTGYCAPCRRLEETLGRGGFNASRGHGGITARVLGEGWLAIGDEVTAEGPDGSRTEDDDEPSFG